MKKSRHVEIEREEGGENETILKGWELSLDYQEEKTSTKPDQKPSAEKVSLPWTAFLGGWSSALQQPAVHLTWSPVDLPVSIGHFRISPSVFTVTRPARTQELGPRHTCAFFLLNVP